ncbi:MAG: GIY-YIG nuclease family protein [Chloroflexi bacterium]|nr:GIY-YIG nuclease family protein [Chloroflexota bacterium]
MRSEQSGRYYVGSTKDIAQRLAQHNAGMMKATRQSRPWRLVYIEPSDTLSAARRREAQIKSWKSPGYMRKALGL